MIMRIVRTLHYHSENYFVIIYNNLKINPIFGLLSNTIIKRDKKYINYFNTTGHGRKERLREMPQTECGL